MTKPSIVSASVEHAEQIGNIVRAARHEAYDKLGSVLIDHMHDDEGGYAAHFERILDESYYACVAVSGQRVFGAVIAELTD